MSGRLSGEFNDIFDALVSVNTDILAYIDFPDEVDDVDADSVLATLYDINKKLILLENSFNIGSAVTEGVDTVIVGTPNVGKSTLLNAILGYERAIVSDTAGTTRDMVSERAKMGDITLNLCDTAGIREAGGDIEKIGIDIAKRELQSAELVFAVFDGARALSQDDMDIIDLCRGKNAIAVINKSDLEIRLDKALVCAAFEYVVEISAKNNDGIESIAKIVNERYSSADIENGLMLTNVRHYQRVVKARERVENAISSLEGGFTPDLASVDITDAASEIGLITGAGVSDKIIDDIFSKFCVGK